MVLVKQNTSGLFTFLVSPGSTAVAYRVIFNGGSTIGSGSFNQAGDGVTVTLNTADSANLGSTLIEAIDAGGNTIGSEVLNVVAFDPYDGVALGLSDLTNIAGQVTTIAGDLVTVLATLSALPTLATLYDGVRNLQDLAKIMSAVLCGPEATTAGVTVFQNIQGTKNVVTTQATAGGNRTPPTLDLS